MSATYQLAQARGPSAPWLVELRDIAVASWGLPLRICGESGTTRSGVSPSWFALLGRTVSDQHPVAVGCVGDIGPTGGRVEAGGEDGDHVRRPERWAGCTRP